MKKIQALLMAFMLAVTGFWGLALGAPQVWSDPASTRARVPSCPRTEYGTCWYRDAYGYSLLEHWPVTTYGHVLTGASNNSISCVWNNDVITIFYDTSDFAGKGLTVPANTTYWDLQSHGFNDMASSVWVIRA